ncbi:hypothetical protein [His2 virus]|uniref:Uncharacterized protein n=1 Tax=His 2 virus TaxID=128710 RepID=Q25BE3_HIS2V|nr:hypothetical protein His2V_gp17 [His2 virus]AAQ13777.1 hypothetical protein [His2 virus]
MGVSLIDVDKCPVCKCGRINFETDTCSNEDCDVNDK